MRYSQLRLLPVVLLAYAILFSAGCQPKSQHANDVETSVDEIVRLLRRGHIVFDRSELRDIAVTRWELAEKAALLAKRPIPILDHISVHRTALVVVDMQRAFLDEGAAIEVPQGRSIIDNINELCGAVRSNGGLVIFLRYEVSRDTGLLKYFEGQSYLGDDRESPLVALRSDNPQFRLHPDLDVRDGDLVLNKHRYSAVLGSHLVDTLRIHDVANVIVTGVTTDVCAGNTAEDLMQRDFHVVVVWDGTAAMSRLEHELYLARIFGLYADVMPTQEVLRRLTTD